MSTTIVIVFIFGIVLGFILGNEKARKMVFKTKRTRNTKKTTKKGNKS